MTTHVQEFSCRPLRNGDCRTIAVLSGRGRPAVAVSIFRSRAPLTRALFFESDLPVLEDALAHACDDGATERRDAGDVPCGAVAMHVWATPGAIWLQRRNLAGEPVSGCTRLVGAEIDAVEKAAAYLRRLVATDAELEVR